MSFQPADRIASIQPYFFARQGSRIAELIQGGRDVIRMDIGSPDLPPADFIIDALVTRARQPGVHGYTAFGGTPAYRQAIADYYGRRFGVELDPKNNVVGLIGSKEGIFALNQVILNPGDIALIPDPGYGTYAISARIAGAEVYPLPILEENDYLPDLGAIPPEVAGRAKVLWLNYPNNPTGAVAPLEFFQAAIAFAREYNVLIAHDTPYADLCYDGYVAPSLMQVPGAFEYAVEFNSASKAYNMAGWRLGSAVGNRQVLQFIQSFKNQKDTAHFEPVLYAGIQAMTGDQAWVQVRNQVYARRIDCITAGLERMGFDARRPRAALYTWTRTPGGMDDVDFSDRLLEEAGVSVTPGTVFGANGAGYFRMTVCIDDARIEEAMVRMAAWMEKEGYD